MIALNSKSSFKILLILSLLVALVCLGSLQYLKVDISGDGVPNISQQGPPIDYPWDQAIIRILIAVLSLGVAVYTWRMINAAVR